jgi:tRNA-dihydrouridine synthase
MAGSSLLRDPSSVFDVVASLVRAADGAAPVTVKMRR